MGRLRKYPAPSRRKLLHDAGPPEPRGGRRAGVYRRSKPD